MAITFDGAQTIHVSGTASIGSDGRSRHPGDRDAQVVETLLSITALLEPRGATLGDISAGTFFYKDEEGKRAYDRVIRLLGLAPLPLVPMMADICRPELLVEIEAVAIVETPREDFP